MDTALTLGYAFIVICLIGIGLMIITSAAVWLVDRRTKKELDEIEKGSRRL